MFEISKDTNIIDTRIIFSIKTREISNDGNNNISYEYKKDGESCAHHSGSPRSIPGYVNTESFYGVTPFTVSNQVQAGDVQCDNILVVSTLEMYGGYAGAAFNIEFPLWQIASESTFWGVMNAYCIENLPRLEMAVYNYNGLQQSLPALQCTGDMHYADCDADLPQFIVQGGNVQWAEATWSAMQAYATGYQIFTAGWYRYGAQNRLF